jgi:hypothetical protein
MLYVLRGMFDMRFCVHQLRIIRVDERKRELQTQEHGGPLRDGNHLLQVKQEPDGTCQYTDVVEIAAGLLTPAAWLIA